MESRPAVFLDRDGTLNSALVSGDGLPGTPHGLRELEIVPGAAQELERLKRAGFYLVVVTNQPEVARGTLNRRAVERIHAALRRSLPLDAILCCYHDDADDCACRKPRPGMLIDAAERFGLHLARSYLIGDRWRDVEAGRQAGCTTVLLRRAYSEVERASPDFEAAGLAEAIDRVLRCWEERDGENLRR